MQSPLNLTPRIQETLKICKKVAFDLNNERVNLHHLSYALFLSRSPSIEVLLNHFEINDKEFLEVLSSDFEAFSEIIDEDDIEASPLFNKVVEQSFVLADKKGHQYIGVEHFLHSLIKIDKSPLLEAFKGFKIQKKDILIVVNNILDEKPVSGQTKKSNKKLPEGQSRDISNLKFLSKYAVNYNQLALDGKLDMVIGQDDTLEKMSEILCRKKKNNVVLIGEGGVGKTSVVEKLAQHIVNRKVNNFLLNKEVYALDMSALVAGTKYRGEFEARIKKVVNELLDNPQIILFIDEIHTMVGAGGAEGRMDAANILKPALARGEISVIGATTFGEYKKSIAKDGALSRRFDSIFINEPTRDECIEILKGAKDDYEKFHKVIYKDDVLTQVVDLSIKYLPTLKLPDKAIDILDQAGSKVKIENYVRPKSIVYLEEQIEALMDAQDEVESDEEAEEIVEKQSKFFHEYQRQLNKWEKNIQDKKVFVKNKDIIKIVSEKTGISEEVVGQNNAKKLLSLKDNLFKRIINQDESINGVYNALLRSSLGFKDNKKPIGSFLFLGTTGVGKTLTAKELSINFFGSDVNLIRFNMSEFSDKTSVGKLIGSSPGYVGHEEGGLLVDEVRKKPFSVVLFDEIEKAHPEVVQLLLQVLDEGEIQDSLGRKAFFSNCIVILTGNIGADILQKDRNSMGFGVSEESEQAHKKEKIISAAKKQLSPELLGRIDETVVFNSFNDEALLKIVKYEIHEFQKRMSETCKNVEVKVSSRVIELLKNEAKEANLGARPITQVVKNKIINKVAEILLELDESKDACKIEIKTKRGSGEILYEKTML